MKCSQCKRRIRKREMRGWKRLPDGTWRLSCERCCLKGGKTDG